MARRIRSLRPELLPVAHEYRHVGFVYFFRDVDTGDIKIGYSWHPGRRLHEVELRTGRTLECIGFFVGRRIDEHALHRMFRKSWIEQEWFRSSDELLSLVESLKVCPYARCAESDGALA